MSRTIMTIAATLALAPEWIVADYIVETDGTTRNFYFNQSKYINNIDKSFDYKHERKAILESLEKKRLERLSF